MNRCEYEQKLKKTTTNSLYTIVYQYSLTPFPLPRHSASARRSGLTLRHRASRGSRSERSVFSPVYPLGVKHSNFGHHKLRFFL